MCIRDRETLSKARALLLAVQIAERGFGLA